MTFSWLRNFLIGLGIWQDDITIENRTHLQRPSYSNSEDDKESSKTSKEQDNG